MEFCTYMPIYIIYEHICAKFHIIGSFLFNLILALESYLRTFCSKSNASRVVIYELRVSRKRLPSTLQHSLLQVDVVLSRLCNMRTCILENIFQITYIHNMYYVAALL